MCQHLSTQLAIADAEYGFSIFRLALAMNSRYERRQWFCN